MRNYVSIGNAMGRRFGSKAFLPSFLPLVVFLWMNPYLATAQELLLSDNGKNSAETADWKIQVTEKAELSVSYMNAPLISARYVFWGAKWNWANPRISVGPASADGAKKLSGNIKGLNIDISGTVTVPGPNQLRYTWNVQANKSMADIIGGGLEFNVNLKSPSLQGRSSTPVLMPDNSGWAWITGTGDEIRIKFDKPIASVKFEKGNRGKIRTLFVGKTLRQGQYTVSMTITLPKGGRVVDKAGRYGPADSERWYSNALLAEVSPVDLSFLNHKPAGLHGFVKARGSDFVFEDGEPIRFWGTNIAAGALFMDKKKIKIQAKRLARLGYNLVRLHHHDSTGWVKRTVIDQNKKDTRQFDPEVMDRMDYWIKALKDEGIYVWLDLHVGRLFKRGDNLGPGADEILAKTRTPEKGAGGKGYNYFNKRIELLMREFNEKYLTHVNSYTKLAYVDEPAIMGLLITNENDLTNHFGNRMLPNKNNPVHNKIFSMAVKRFVNENTAANENEEKNWREKLKKGRQALRQDWAPSWVPIIGKRGKVKGPYADTWKTWLPGPSKIFLADREWQWNRRMLSHLRSIGVKVPVSTTNMWGGMQMYGLPALSAGDMIDVHAYGKAEALSENPRYTNNFISYMATGQLSGKPVSISEWNVAYPQVDRFTSPLYVASIASLQGWDAPMIYNYSQRGIRNRGKQGRWSTFMDPALTGLMPAAALLYRQRHVKESSNTYLIKLNREQLYYSNTHPKNMASLRTLVEQSKVTFGLPDVKELDWDSETKLPKGVKLVTDLGIDFIPPGQDFVQSDTGELVRSWVKGYQSINTERTQGVHGWIGEKQFKLRDVAFQIKTKKAAVIVSSLDGEPINRSRRLLVTAIARAVAGKNNQKPMMSEPVEGEITIQAQSGLKLYALTVDGTKVGPIPAIYRENSYRLTLPLPQGTHWFMLE